MQAANESAATVSGQGKSVGIRVDLPFEQVQWMHQAMVAADPPMASAEDGQIPHCVAGADQAIAVLRNYHAASQRSQGTVPQ